VISGAIFDLDATIAARDEIMSSFARRVIGFGVAAPRLKSIRTHTAAAD